MQEEEEAQEGEYGKDLDQAWLDNAKGLVQAGGMSRGEGRGATMREWEYGEDTDSDKVARDVDLDLEQVWLGGAKSVAGVERKNNSAAIIYLDMDPDLDWVWIEGAKGLAGCMGGEHIHGSASESRAVVCMCACVRACVRSCVHARSGVWGTQPDRHPPGQPPSPGLTWPTTLPGTHLTAYADEQQPLHLQRHTANKRAGQGNKHQLE